MKSKFTVDIKAALSVIWLENVAAWREFGGKLSSWILGTATQKAHKNKRDSNISK